MKYVAMALVVIAWVAMVPSATAQAAGNSDTVYTLPPIHNTSFIPGEKLTYRIHYGWLTAGEAVFEVDSAMPIVGNRKAYHFRGIGKSLATFDFFYTVRDEFESWVDPAAMLPYHYIRKVHEGSTRFEDDVVFDQRNRTIKGKKGEFKVQSNTFDLLSAVYLARCLNVRNVPIGRFYRIPTFLDDKVYPLGLTVLGRETIKTHLGTFRCIKISPRVIASTVFKAEDQMVIWVTDDENYLPVRIESPIIVGTVRCELVGYQRLRNPLTSQVK